MRAPLRKSITAVAIVLVGASLASAFPINNKTSTATSGAGTAGLSGFAVTVMDVNTGASSALYSSVNTTAKQFRTNINSGMSTTTPSTGKTAAQIGTSGTTPVANPAVGTVVSYAAYAPTTKNFSTFCVELTEGLDSTNVTTAIEKIPPAFAPPDGRGYVPNSDVALQRAAFLIQNRVAVANGAGYSNSSVIAAAAQIAVWEIIYDAGANKQGDVTKYDSATGGGNGTTRGFKASANSSGANQVNDLAAIALANILLSYSWNSTTNSAKLGSGLIFRTQVEYVGESAGNVHLYREVGDNTNQTVITAVPEPTSLAIAGLGALGFLGYGIRRRARA